MPRANEAAKAMFNLLGFQFAEDKLAPLADKFSLALDWARPMLSFFWFVCGFWFVFVLFLLLRCFGFVFFVLVVSLDCDCCGTCTGSTC